MKNRYYYTFDKEKYIQSGYNCEDYFLNLYVENGGKNIPLNKLAKENDKMLINTFESLGEYYGYFEDEGYDVTDMFEFDNFKMLETDDDSREYIIEHLNSLGWEKV